MKQKKISFVITSILLYVVGFILLGSIVHFLVIKPKLINFYEKLPAPTDKSTITQEYILTKNSQTIESTSTLESGVVNTESSPKQVWQIDNSINGKALGAQMLELVNDARAEEGLSPVEWDSFAAWVATAHAQDMAENKYFSHWNLQGFGPDIRYALAGGSELVMENISNYYEYWSDNTPKQLDNFDQLVIKAHEGLMNSPGHRQNIMDPHHTHVGIGFAYNPETGYFFVAQEFINRYIILSDVADYGFVGQTINMSGSLLLNATEPILNVAYEPFPSPMLQEVLNNTSSYSSSAEFLKAYNPISYYENSFSFEFQLGTIPGFYHIRIWVKLDGEMVQTINELIIID